MEKAFWRAPAALAAGTIALFAIGCGGGGAAAPGAQSSVGGGGKAFQAALTACSRLGIEVRSTRPGSLINGVIPENTDKGRPLVNMTFSGGRVKIEFYNAPDTPGWQAQWRERIVNAIQSAGSAGGK